MVNGPSHSDADANLSALRLAFVRILTPLVRVAIRFGFSYRAFAEILKETYVNVARRDFQIPGRKQSASRIAVLTGMPRKEVARWVKPDRSRMPAAIEPVNGAARVLAGWRRDRRFTDNRGRPIALPLEDGPRSFAGLVRRYGNDVPVRAVLDELVRVGAVKRLRNGKVRLLARAYLPSATKADTIGTLGTNIRDLAMTITHNIDADASELFFERKVSYDNIPSESLPALRSATAKLAQTTLEKADRMIARRDRDATPSVKGTGRNRVVLGMFYLHEPVSGEDPQ